jgi:diguanylate cyclase (GGDEF)-like protein
VSRNPLATLVLLWVGFAAFAPAPARAAETPSSIAVFSMPGAAAAFDPGGAATVDDVAAGRPTMVPVEHFAFPNQASYVRPAIVWVRIPPDPAWTAGAFSVETSFNVAHATLYEPAPGGAWQRVDFGMAVPYAQRTIARLVPTARIDAGAGGPLYLRLEYLLESPNLRIANEAAIAAERHRADAEEPFLLALVGVLIALACTNLILYGFALQRIYLIYSVAMILAAISAGTLGYPFAWKWFWPGLAPPYSLTASVSASGFVTIVVLFTMELLNLRAWRPALYRLSLAILVVGDTFVIALPLWFASAHAGPVALLTIAEAMTLVSYVLMIVAGGFAWRRGDSTAPYVVAGYCCHALGAALFIATAVPPGNIETASGIYPTLGTTLDGMLLFAALASRLQRLQREALEQAVAAAEQRRLAYTDGLTGVANRRAYDERLVREWERGSREGAVISMILIDVDYFKRYNDTYGHVAGDACLQSVAKAAERCARRPTDLFARYGGEEFVALLPGTDESAALRIAEAMCEAVRALQIPHRASSLGIVSISVGVASATVPPFREQTLATEADAALYRAKQAGRNRVASSERVGDGPAVEARSVEARS